MGVQTQVVVHGVLFFSLIAFIHGFSKEVVTPVGRSRGIIYFNEFKFRFLITLHVFLNLQFFKNKFKFRFLITLHFFFFKFTIILNLQSFYLFFDFIKLLTSSL